MPPLRSLGAEHQTFLRNARKLEPELVEEICAFHSEWLAAFAKIGTEAEMRGVVANKVSEFMVGMLDVSLKEVVARYDYVKPIDDAWRAANPEKSAQFPTSQ